MTTAVRACAATVGAFAAAVPAAAVAPSIAGAGIGAGTGSLDRVAERVGLGHAESVLRGVQGPPISAVDWGSLLSDTCP